MAKHTQRAADVLTKMLAWSHYGESELLTKEHLPQFDAKARELIGRAACESSQLRCFGPRMFLSLLSGS